MAKSELEGKRQVTFGEALNAAVNAKEKEQDKQGYYFWNGPEIGFKDNEEIYRLFLKVPKDPKEGLSKTVKEYLSSAGKYLLPENKPFSGSHRVLFFCDMGPGPFYCLDDAKLQTTETIQPDNISRKITSRPAKDLTFIGKVIWGQSGMFSYEGDLYIPTVDYEKVARDLKIISHQKESIKKLRLSIPIPGSDKRIVYFSKNL